jgi:hypothetical protein
MKKDQKNWIIAGLAIVVLFLWFGQIEDEADEYVQEDLSEEQMEESSGLEKEMESEESDDGESLDLEISIDEAKANDMMNDTSAPAQRSFTHRGYGYSLSFPVTWHWDGLSIDTLVISSESIVSSKDPLDKNNIKIYTNDQDMSGDGVEILELGTANGETFKAAYLKDHNYSEIIKDIVASFK